MARPKEFDPGKAMQEAMEAFWERGYHGTSISDLLAEMHLNRGSLYGTFGDKKKLFLAALDEYHKQVQQVVVGILEQPGSAREAIEELFSISAKACCGDEGVRGCLALKAALEMAPQDEEVAEWVRNVTRERELLLARTIRRGQEAGEINAQHDARAVARYLICSMTGLKVLGTASPSERSVREVVELTLRVLD